MFDALYPGAAYSVVKERKKRLCVPTPLLPLFPSFGNHYCISYFFPITSLNGFFLVFKVICWLGFKYTNSNIFASAVSQSFVSCYPTPSTARSLPSHDPTLLISLFQSHKIHYPYSTKSSAPQTLARQKAYAVPGCGGSMVQLVV